MFANSELHGHLAGGEAGPAANQGWEACLEMGFAFENGKTVLTHRRHQGPLVVQRPFYPGDGVCHAYLLHPPGGLVAGDRITIDVAVEKDAAALLTTPAAGKFYRSDGCLARQSVSLTVAERGALEWLPQETIIFKGARMKSAMHIELESNASFIGWEMLAFGRPAAQEHFNNGEAELSWRILRSGKPFYSERLELDAEAFEARWGLDGHAACGTLFACPATLKTLATVRELIGDRRGMGVTRIDDMLVCRGLDSRIDHLRLFYESVWSAIREDIAGRIAKPPRIWAT
ncbi:MAG: urease accessory protein UreD [Gammaproteobacteria bacterium]